MISQPYHVGVGGEEVYNGKGEKPMLASLSDLYSKLETISISASGLSSSTSHYLLTTYTTDYYLKGNVYNFGLRRPFYSRQCFKSDYHVRKQ